MELKLKRALISVSDKSNLDVLAKALVEQGVELIASGGTKKYLENEGHCVTAVESISGNPECFAGRMKTLSFQIMSSLLYKRSSEKDCSEAQELNIVPIDIVVCNFYPFSQMCEKVKDDDELIEYIDIGGPTMVRSAAKNYKDLLCLTDPKDYFAVCDELKARQSISLETRKRYMRKAFSYTMKYEQCISERFFCEEKLLRYGENPHQKARIEVEEENSLASAKSLQGKALSYNNYLDMDAAFACCSDLKRFNGQLKSVVVIKHSTPCGVAMSEDLLKSLELAWAGDPVSSFGSIICFSHELDEKCAKYFSQKFVEVLMAPSFSPEALKILEKKKNLRLISTNFKNVDRVEMRRIHGGLLIQDRDLEIDREFQVVTSEKSNFSSDLASFGTIVVKNLKSNGITLVKEENGAYFQVGMGAGNPNRLVSVLQAVEKAKENKNKDFKNLYLISDAFFPFKDNIELANSFNIKNIVQPGGSIKDNEVIEACNQFGIQMAFTGRRHFKH